MCYQRLSCVLLIIAIAVTFPFALSAQSGGSFEIDRSTASDAGGGVSAGGDFQLSGSIGQADAGQHTGGDFSLTGGFWVDAETDVLFKDGFE